MRQFQTTNAPFKERTFYKQQELEVMCLGELRKQGLLPTGPEPIRIEHFLKKRFGLTPDYSQQLPAGILGVTKFGEKGPVQMLVSRGLADDPAESARRRLNSTLAHEAGHCLLHGYLFAMAGKKSQETLPRQEFGVDDVDVVGGRMLCRAPGEATGHYDRKWWEWQADAMIGPLLMPSPLVGKLLRTEFSIAMPISPNPRALALAERDAAAAKIAETFDVNPAAARFRLEKLGFVVGRP